MNHLLPSRLMPIIFGLILSIAWGRSMQPQTAYIIQPTHWSPAILQWQKAIAGPVPGLGADIAILRVFNIYAQSKQMSDKSWIKALANELKTAQALDPYFKDTYRLAEGLLAYEARDYRNAINILKLSEPYLHEYEPLMVAAFLARHELNDPHHAAAIAHLMAKQPNAPPLAVNFAAKLISESNGCQFAIKFLQTRLKVMPITYKEGILRRIKELKENKSCQ